MVISQKNRAMQTEYGMGNTAKCKGCCNLHYAPDKKSVRACIAFGYREDMNCDWDEDFAPCGLYNKPFMALRPTRRPLVEVYGPKKKAPTEDPMQESLF